MKWETRRNGINDTGGTLSVALAVRPDWLALRREAALEPELRSSTRVFI